MRTCIRHAVPGVAASGYTDVHIWLTQTQACAGKLLGFVPQGQHAVDLQRALTKATSVALMQQPPLLETAEHMVRVLAAAEGKASEAPKAATKPFITFDDTFAKYAELLAIQASGAPTHARTPTPHSLRKAVFADV
jgi:hypothetical protein